MIFESLILFSSYLFVGCNESIGANIKQQNNTICSDNITKGVASCKCCKKAEFSCQKCDGVTEYDYITFYPDQPQKSKPDTLEYIFEVLHNQNDRKCIMYRDSMYFDYDMGGNGGLLGKLKKKFGKNNFGENNFYYQKLPNRKDFNKKYYIKYKGKQYQASYKSNSYYICNYVDSEK